MELSIEDKMALKHILEAGVAQFKCSAATGLLMHCFDVEEAQFCRSYMSEHYPSIPFNTTYLIFKGDKNGTSFQM